MPNPHVIRLRSPAPFVLLALAAAAAGCGSSPVTITVQSHTLTLAETVYGKQDPVANPSALPYCQPLDSRGQFEVVLTDFSLCGQITNKASTQTIYHSSDETNLRFVFPTFFMKNPNGSFKVNTFAVNKTSFCKSNTSQAVAVAFFAHNSAMQSMYDVHVEAESGSISVTGYDGSTDLKGTYDLIFGTGDHVDHITGAFDATFCAGLNSDYDGLK